MQAWFIPTFAFWSVPWFFLCSGFFFVDSYDRHGILGLLRRKTFSLLLPYVIWCLLGALIMQAPVCELGFVGAVVKMFALQGTHPSWNRALWFLRALILFSLIGSITLYGIGYFRILQGRVRLVVYALIFLSLVQLIKLCGIKFGPGSSSVYFVLGALLSSTLRGQDRLGRFIMEHVRVVSWILIVGAVLFRMLWFVLGFSYDNPGGVIGHLINNLAVVLFILWIWYVGDKLSPAKDGWLMTVCSVSSFVYFSHQPLMDYVWRTTHSLLGATDLAFIANFIVAMMAFPTLALILRRLPGYRILSGGR